jgi:hypothetical protein
MSALCLAGVSRSFVKEGTSWLPCGSWSELLLQYVYLQVKEVIMAYFVLMSQGKATDEVSNKNKHTPLE